MSLVPETPKPDQHALSTRLVHAGLALSICTQLATSLIMQGPTDTSAGDAIFQLHRDSGFAALDFAVLFWMTLAFRRRGTAPSALFPWFSGARRSAFSADQRPSQSLNLAGNPPQQVPHVRHMPLATAPRTHPTGIQFGRHIPKAGVPLGANARDHTGKVLCVTIGICGNRGPQRRPTFSCPPERGRPVRVSPRYRRRPPGSPASPRSLRSIHSRRWTESAQRPTPRRSWLPRWTQHRRRLRRSRTGLPSSGTGSPSQGSKPG